ncbi:hypothetical protein M9H77_14486 [Catharanthus roseus]|uniref:Uncharacterized protein n=1 Tax=Catharanthus roseus TaxID=4058 RepID=A0ACC0BN58_CATRO|nr:hypothetical protein M9H77_14486 [Catharanthus roseus]
MSKNKGKGGKNRKRGKNESDNKKCELMFKEDGQEYAQVVRMLGNGRCKAMKMHKKVWITAGNIILVGLRDYQDDNADVIRKLNEGIAGDLDEDEDGPDNNYIEFGDEDMDHI